MESACILARTSLCREATVLRTSWKAARWVFRTPTLRSSRRFVSSATLSAVYAFLSSADMAAHLAVSMSLSSLLPTRMRDNAAFSPPSFSLATGVRHDGECEKISIQ